MTIRQQIEKMITVNRKGSLPNSNMSTVSFPIWVEKNQVYQFSVGT